MKKDQTTLTSFFLLAPAAHPLPSRSSLAKLVLRGQRRGRTAARLHRPAPGARSRAESPWAAAGGAARGHKRCRMANPRADGGSLGGYESRGREPARAGTSVGRCSLLRPGSGGPLCGQAALGTCSRRNRSRSVKNSGMPYRPTFFLEIIQRIGRMAKDEQGREY